jgi:protein SCO1/2
MIVPRIAASSLLFALCTTARLVEAQPQVAKPDPVVEAAPSRERAAAAPVHGTEEAGTPIDDASIYQLDSVWTRADGAKVALSSLRGKVRVLAIFYSSCEYACPILVGRMKSVQAALEQENKDGAGFVLVSMDPGRDDPARLRDYAARMGLAGDWTLLQGAEVDVRELAALLGFRYRQEKDGGFAHSNMLSVLDREGRLAYRSVGLDRDVDEAVGAVKKLLP